VLIKGDCVGRNSYEIEDVYTGCRGGCCRLSYSCSACDVNSGKDRNYYAVEPEITTPEYKTDAARAIDAYERLMERYMDLAESNLQQAGADYQVVVSRLDSLDSRLEEVSSRLARIEKKLGVEPDANGTAKLKAVK